MKLISHRGNTNGKSEGENHPSLVETTLNAGFDCEIDVWLQGGEWYLGHDCPLYPISFDFLERRGLWCHAKDLRTLEAFTSTALHFFWHEHDSFSLTSRGYIWTEPLKPLGNLSICLFPERTEQDFSKSYGICSDFITLYKT